MSVYGSGPWGLGWVLPLSNSWIINIIWLYIALNRTPNIDCYWVGAVPKVQGSSRLIEAYVGLYSVDKQKEGDMRAHPPDLVQRHTATGLGFRVLNVP